MDFDSPAAAQKAVASLKANGVQAQMAKVRKPMKLHTQPGSAANNSPAITNGAISKYHSLRPCLTKLRTTIS